MKLRIIALLIVLLLVAGGAVLVAEHNGAFHAGVQAFATEGSQETTEEQDSTSDHPVLVEATEEVVSGTPAAGNMQNPVHVLAVGDIMLGRGVGARLQKSGSFDKAFQLVAPLLKNGDIVFANIESPLTDSTHGLDSSRKIVLKARPESAAALSGAGFNLVSIANNHMMDYYERGLFDTISALSANNIQYAGGGKTLADARSPAIIEKNGLKVGLLAYTDMAELIFAGTPYLSYAAEANKSGVVPRKMELIREDIEKLKGQVDLIAISLHWGVEESFTIPPAQVEFAHELIDAGADVILGHHPHQYQGIEIYHGKPIFYSMGNFLFDQNEPENMESYIADMTYQGNELVKLQAIPVRILDKSFVEIQSGDAARNILVREQELSSRLGTAAIIDGDQLVYDLR